MADRTDDFRRDAGTYGTDGASAADTAAIRADIRETRQRMGHTLEELSERLNPDHLREQVKHNIREATIGRAEHMARHAVGRVDETRHSIMDTIRDNPLPAAMVGVGLGWLFWNGRKDDGYDTADYRYRPVGRVDNRYAGGMYEEPAYGRGRYDEPGVVERTRGRVSEIGETARDRTENIAGRAQETVSDFADRTRETASDLTERTHEAVDNMADRARSAADSLARGTRSRAHRVEDRFQGALHENPLAVGAAAMAVGLVAGLSAPTTRAEIDFMGETRDHLVDRAREFAGETSDKVQQVAQRVASETQSTAKEVVKEAAKEQGLTSSQGGSTGSGDSGRAGTGML